MSEHSHLPADLVHDEFEREVRGYSRRQVDETLAGLRLSIRTMEDGKHDLEDRLSQALDDNERLKLELSAARSNGRPPHEEISERIGQILKLADDEAKSQRAKADEEIGKLRSDAQAETTKLRTDAKAETDKNRAEAQEQAERMLSAAQEQAEHTVATAKSEAEKTRKSAAAEAQQVVAEATKQSETALATAKAQAKQQLDEATARATAIHDGAERRLNLLMSRHTEAIRRLTEIRDVVTTLVAGETDRGSLEDEVARSVAGAVAAANAAAEGKQAGVRPGPEGRHASGPIQADGLPVQGHAGQVGPAQGHPVGHRPVGVQQQSAAIPQGNASSRPGPEPVRAAERPRQAGSDDTANGVPVSGE